MRLIDTSVLTVTAPHSKRTWTGGNNSERRHRFRQVLQREDSVDPDSVIMTPKVSASRGLTNTLTFPVGNLAPEGSVIKSTAIDPAVVEADGVYRKRRSGQGFS